MYASALPREIISSEICVKTNRKFEKHLSTGTAWIGLEQNIIDTAVNEWRKRLLACVRIVDQYFKQFYCRQLKNRKRNEMSATVSEM